MTQEGILIVISGPSGTGKSTIVKEFIRRNPSVQLSVSATTRKARPGEVEGINYFFHSEDEFQKKLHQDAFLEHAVVYGNYYGTPREFVREQLERGKDVLLEIDTAGAMQVRKKFSQGVFLFILPPSMEELHRRINHRGTETPEELERRMNSALEEILHLGNYDYAVMNDHVSDAVQLIESILKAEKASVVRSRHYWLKTFSS
ncbi:guanylate kinase [Anoxynatronum buryatiense]|uniref:Guanylate kinase n=1 Tax=Anoxynatronum buryatiense TaxID=489973 RepID=A0AA45WU81_9CLOT|nr:guanylate kinase [Anoxynatronum buryatiense]SMP46862.1 guanylate kinase [Anoxynatronum buryatiense]